MSTKTDRDYTDADVDQCVAQARKWAASRDNGWTPNREQVAVLADEVERLRATVQAAALALLSEMDVPVDASPADIKAAFAQYGLRVESADLARTAERARGGETP